MISITALAATAQEAERPASQVPPRVLPPVAAELVEVDVVVTDRRGRPVSDLTPDDFVLLEDGKPQRVAFFLAGDVGRPPAPVQAPPLARPAPVEMRLTPGRYVVLAIDDLHMSAESLVRAKEALRRLIDEQLSAEDQVAVVTTSGALGFVQPFTPERPPLRWAIDRISYHERRADAGGRASMSEYQAQAIERGDPQALDLAVREIEQRQELAAPIPSGGGPNPRLESEARGMARTLLSQALDMSRATLNALEEALRGLDGVPGRKLVVLVSDGFLMGAGTPASRRFDLRALMDVATRARVSVFALHARGLLALPTEADASRPASPVQTLPGLQERYAREGDQALREGMRDLAESTGGFFIHGTNDLGAAMAQILDANAAAYLLAYEPLLAEGGGRFRRIEVKLPRHPELAVHARRGYFSADERTARAGLSVAAPAAAQRARPDALRLALASLVPLRDVPLDLAADFVDTPSEGSRLVIRAHVDLAQLAFESAGGRQEAALEFVSVVYAESGSVAVEAEGERAEMRLSPANHERMLQEGLGYQRSVAVKPGSYQVRVVVREERSGRLGSAWRWVDVPDLGSGALALSDVVLFAEPATTTGDASRAGGLKDVQARPRYARGANLYYVAYAYNPRRADQGGTDVVAQAQVWTAGRLQGASPAEPLSFDGKAASASGRIALEGLGAGEYELRLLVVDRMAKATVQQRVAFTIE